MRPELAELINGDVDAALTKVAAVAVRAKQAMDLASIGSTLGGLKDQAMPMLSDLGGRAGSLASSVWANPHARAAIIGSGIGAGTNLLADQFLRKKHKRRGALRAILEGGGIGAGVGGGGSLLASNMPALSQLKLGASKSAAPSWLTSLGDTAGDLGGKAMGYAKDVWANPHGRAALIGGGIGLGAGALGSVVDERRRKNWLSNALTTAALGAATAGGGSLAYEHFLGKGLGKGAVPGASGGVGGGQGAGPQDLGTRARAATKAQEGYDVLGRLGFDDKKVQQAGADVRSGDTNTDQAVSRIQREGPRGISGIREQVGGILPGTLQAARTGDVGGAAAHADVLGLKNINPISENFSPLTAGLAVGGNLAARGLQPGGALRSGGGLGNWAGKKVEQLATSTPGWSGDISIPFSGGRKITGLPYQRELGTATTWLHEKAKGLAQRQAQKNQQHLLGSELAHAQAGLKPKEFVEMQHQFDFNPLAPDAPAGAIPPPKTLKEQLDWARSHRQARLTGKTPSGGKGGDKGDKGTKPAGPGMMHKLTGGPLATAALLAPLMGREWLSSGGYRSGHQPAMGVAEANKILGGQ